jgi:hypothetical protein
MDKAWKCEERIVAKAFNTTRALMKGTNEKSDIDSDMFCVDVKLRQRWQVDKWYDELRDYAQKCDKIPILTLRQPRQHRRLAVVDFDFFSNSQKRGDDRLTTCNTTSALTLKGE